MTDAVTEAVGSGHFRVRGAMTFDTAARLAAADWSATELKQLQVDLSEVDHVDSAGLAVLVDWVVSARAAGRGLAFEGAPSQLVAIARVSGVDTLLGLSEPGDVSNP